MYYVDAPLSIEAVSMTQTACLNWSCGRITILAMLGAEHEKGSSIATPRDLEHRLTTEVTALLAEVDQLFPERLHNIANASNAKLAEAKSIVPVDRSRRSTPAFGFSSTALS